MITYSGLKAFGNLYVTTNRVAGDLASWAVQQSPYACPDNLQAVIERFVDLWSERNEDCKQWPSMGALEAELDETFLLIPELMAWNERRNGREGMGFSSRYDKPSPDDDFIDLNALSRNVAMSAWAEAVDFKKFNDDFDRRRTATQSPDA
jgi:hypothetical protein